MDLAIVTHADSDHFKGMSAIFKAYNVSEFWYTGYTSPKLERMTSWNSFLRVLDDEEDCVTRFPIKRWKKAGDTVVIDRGGSRSADDDVKILLLNTDADPPAHDSFSRRNFRESQLRNNASLVFKLIHGKVSFLFTGDINGRKKSRGDPDYIDSEELELWIRHTLKPRKFNLKSTVLQIAHHGSDGSSSRPFLRAVAPEWAVITAGHAYNHPTPRTLKRLKDLGINVLRTDEGDSTPENKSVVDPRGDDSIVFQANRRGITRIFKVRAR